MTRSIVWISENDAAESFPPVDRALKEPSGLLAAGGDLSPKRLIAAYRRGIFPWYSPGQPILWWSPDPRAVLAPSAMKVSRSLAKRIRNGGLETTLNTDFHSVIAACGSRALRPEGTWLTSEMRQAYTQLHQLGFAHSVEAWLDGRLVGGLYGVAIGRMFFGESMFSIERDASKIALKRLCDECVTRQIELIDCQMETPHLVQLGATLMPRNAFAQRVAVLTSMDADSRAWESPPLRA